MSKFYADKTTGAYLGAFDGYDDATGKRIYPPKPANSIEVMAAPTHGAQRWNGQSWEDTPEVARVTAAAELADSDKRMARVGEDVIAVLIAKGIITINDLPASARSLLIARDQARGKL